MNSGLYVIEQYNICYAIKCYAILGCVILGYVIVSLD